MQQNLRISIDDKLVNNKETVPECFAESLFAYESAVKWGVTDERVDLLIQTVDLSDYSFWKYDMLAYSPCKLYFEVPMKQMVVLFNMGEDISVQVGSQPVVLLKTNEHKMFHVPKFEMSLYPNDSKNKYELILIDAGDGKSEKTTELLLRSILGSKTQ